MSDKTVSVNGSGYTNNENMQSAEEEAVAAIILMDKRREKPTSHDVQLTAAIRDRNLLGTATLFTRVRFTSTAIVDGNG